MVTPRTTSNTPRNTRRTQRTDQNNVNMSPAFTRINLPKFDGTLCEQYFRLADSQFKLHEISNPVTKYRIIYGLMDLEFSNRIPLKEVHEKEDYEALKAFLINHYNETKPEIYRRMLATKNLTGKPSEIMFKLKTYAQTIGINDDIVRMQFLNSQPNDIARILIGQNSMDLNALAKLADDIAGISEDPHKINNVAKVQNNYQQHYERNYQAEEEESETSYSNKYPRRENYHYYQEPQQVHNINNSNKHLAKKEYKNNGQTNNTTINERGIVIPYSVQPFTADQRPKVCRFHLYYGHKARKCVQWCQWPNKARELEMTKSSRPGTPLPDYMPPNKRRRINTPPRWGENCFKNNHNKNQWQENDKGVYY